MMKMKIVFGNKHFWKLRFQNSTIKVTLHNKVAILSTVKLEQYTILLEYFQLALPSSEILTYPFMGNAQFIRCQIAVRYRL
jgi:hypothetical protein